MKASSVISALMLSSLLAGCGGSELVGDLAWQGDECQQMEVCTTPPTPTVVSPVLEPPNHKYHDINLLTDCAVTWDSPCGPVSPESTAIVCVGSDEPINDLGDGNTVADIVIVDGLNVQLRAERSGAVDGRCYYLYFEGIDAAGNVGTGTCIVQIPHGDQPVVCGNRVYSVCRSP